MIYNKYNFNVPQQKIIRVITNTDAKNEADDQYAIVQTLLSPRFDNRGIIAAHFGMEKSSRSMMDSYEEIQKVLKLMHIPDENLVFKGAEKAMEDAEGRTKEIGENLTKAVASYKEQVIQGNPGVPADMIVGETVEEIDESLEKALALIEKVRQEMEAEASKMRIPGGAPQRTPMDLSGLSAREKIQYAIGGS